MASLKELRTRITSVKSTQRITSAMKMVAAAKLKRAQDQAEQARPYAEKMEAMLRNLAGLVSPDSAPALLVGTPQSRRHLLLVVTSDRGLCGGFNANLLRSTQQRIRDIQSEGQEVVLMVVGRKGVGVLKRNFPDALVQTYEDLCKPAPTFEAAQNIAHDLIQLFDKGSFDRATLVFNRFISALSQEAVFMPLIPFGAQSANDNPAHDGALTLFEPDENAVLDSLVPRNITTQIFRALLESFASEQGARMAAMDNATRNAGDMIQSLSITYNRSRQAQITKELIEIISGAESL